MMLDVKVSLDGRDCTWWSLAVRPCLLERDGILRSSTLTTPSSDVAVKA